MRLARGMTAPPTGVFEVAHLSLAPFPVDKFRAAQSFNPQPEETAEGIGYRLSTRFAVECMCQHSAVSGGEDRPARKLRTESSTSMQRSRWSLVDMHARRAEPTKQDPKNQRPCARFAHADRNGP
jgi:hypothetical protein